MKLVMKWLYFVLVLWLSELQTSECRFNFRMRGSHTCEPIENSLCSVLYNDTSMPNSRNHYSQFQAEEELNQYLGLIELGCSNVLLHLLCAVYVPYCSYEYPDIRLEPCRDLCEHAREGCEHVLLAYNLPWPAHLECSLFPNKAQSLCFGPKVDPSTVLMPALEGLQTSTSSDGPQEFEVVGLEARLVSFYWEPPPSTVDSSTNHTQDSNFNYFLSCVPQPEGFPYELSRIRGPVDVTLSGFVPDTRYICSVFDTRFVSEESAATIEFRTPEGDGGSSAYPENFRAKILGPENVLFMWDPPSSTGSGHPLSYVLSCNPEPRGFPIHFDDISGPIQGIYDTFRPDTMYNCGVYDSVGDEYAVTTAFTTYEPFCLHYVHDTPRIEFGYIHLEFELNRPAEETSCQLLRSALPKQNCTGGVVSFLGLEPGSYTVRIVAENNRYDRFTERMKFTVPRESECIVHLFNSRLTQSGSNVTVEFRSTGSLISGFRCQLDEDDSFQCVSPLRLVHLERGSHDLEISPVGIGNSCTREKDLDLSFQV